VKNILFIFKLYLYSLYKQIVTLPFYLKLAMAYLLSIHLLKLKAMLMTGLQERAYELVENISPVCPKSYPGLFWEEFIITIKSGEVIAWSFNCLVCDQTNCPLFGNLNHQHANNNIIKNYA